MSDYLKELVEKNEERIRKQKEADEQRKKDLAEVKFIVKPSETAMTQPRLEPVCRQYEDRLVEIITALLDSTYGEVIVPCDQYGIKATTMRLNLREARNGFLAGIASTKLPSHFNLNRLEFSLAPTNGVIVRDRERYRKPRGQVTSTKIGEKAPFEVAAIGPFVYSEKLAEAWLLCRQSSVGDAMMWGTLKFHIKDDSELQAIKRIFKDVAVIDIQIKDGLVEVVI